MDIKIDPSMGWGQNTRRPPKDTLKPKKPSKTPEKPFKDIFGEELAKLKKK